MSVRRRTSVPARGVAYLASARASAASAGAGAPSTASRAAEQAGSGWRSVRTRSSSCRRIERLASGVASDCSRYVAEGCAPRRARVEEPLPRISRGRSRGRAVLFGPDGDVCPLNSARHPCRSDRRTLPRKTGSFCPSSRIGDVDVTPSVLFHRASLRGHYRKKGRSVAGIVRAARCRHGSSCRFEHEFRDRLGACRRQPAGAGRRHRFEALYLGRVQNSSISARGAALGRSRLLYWMTYGILSRS